MKRGGGSIDENFCKYLLIFFFHFIQIDDSCYYATVCLCISFFLRKKHHPLGLGLKTCPRDCLEMRLFPPLDIESGAVA